MTILETIPIFEKPGTYAPVIFYSIIAAVTFIFLFYILIHIDIDIPAIICAFLAIISIFILSYGIIKEVKEPEQDTGRIKYIIKLDDTVSVNEFYNKYKILEHPRYSDIYTVEEIKDESNN